MGFQILIENLAIKHGGQKGDLIMATWKEYYKDHLVSMEDAAKSIKSGDNLWVGAATGVPYEFLDALYDLRDGLNNVRILYNVANTPFNMLFHPESKKHFHIISHFTLPLERASGEMGIADFHSCPFEFIFRSVLDVYEANTVAIRVCPPDEDGYCNSSIYGVNSSVKIAKDPRIKKKIGVIDRTQSPAGGIRDEIALHVTEFDYLIEFDSEPTYFPAAGPSPVDQKIAEYVTPFIHDGDKLQIGFGGLGDAVLSYIGSHLSDIEIFTEVACESMVPLLKSGVAKHLTATSCGAGSQELYDILGTDKCTIRDISMQIDPFLIGQQENLVAVNSTFMVDLTGQACSEAQGLKQYSAVGGAFGYLYGTIRSKGGRSLLCLRSTYKDHEGNIHSNIVPWLPEGSIVTTPRYLAMYIISEYGVADVFLRTIKERIKALIKIAHPDFRAELKEKIISVGMISEEDFDD